jgi:hypothetical protein
MLCRVESLERELTKAKLKIENSESGGGGKEEELEAKLAKVRIPHLENTEIGP